MQPELKNRLSQDSTAIETALQQALRPPADITPSECWLWDAMTYSCLNGGKRIRPFLVLETARLLGADANHPHWGGIMDCAVALEMVHCYSLVHDDLPCMDDDDLRRGNPTTHIKYDQATAVLAGDGLLTRAFEIIASANLPAPVVVQIIGTLTNCAGISGMVGGQMIDLRAPIDTPDSATPNSDYIARLQRLKTGRLIDAGCAIPCPIMDATDAQQQALATYTQNIGLAFQIADDILDVTGTAQITGKSVGKDSSAGKSTFVEQLGLQGARDKAQSLINNATQALDIFDGDTTVLRQLADYIINREK